MFSKSIRRATTGATVLLASLVSISPLAAQQVAPPSAAPTPIARAVSDLRQLITAQEAYYAQNARYADDVAKTQFRASTGNTVKLVGAQPNVYSAELTSTAFEGSCVVHIGVSAENAVRTAKEKKVFPEGEPACDGDGEIEDVRWASAATFEVQRQLAAIAKLQEQRFGRTSAYAGAIEELSGVRPNPSVTVTLQVTPSTERFPGFLLTATHARYPGASCILRSGYGPWYRTAMTAQQRKRPANDLQIVCDEFKK